MAKNQKTFSFEELGCPIIGYKYEEPTLEEHLQQSVTNQRLFYPGVDRKYLNIPIDTEKAQTEIREAIDEIAQEFGSDADEWGDLPIKYIEAAAYDTTNKGKDGVTKWRFVFEDGVTDYYGIARQLADKMDWDKMQIEVQERVTDMIEAQNAYLKDNESVTARDENMARWLMLYGLGENMERLDFVQQMSIQFPLDDVINRTFLKMGRKWRGWRKAHGMDPLHEAADFIQWVMDENIDFDTHMAAIGMTVDSEGMARPELSGDIFETQETNKSNGTNQTNQTNNTNTTMTETHEAAAPQTAAQTPAMIDGSEIATKYQKNFATWMANTNIRAAKRTWKMDGNKAMVTAIEEEGEGYIRYSVMTYDTKWKGTKQQTIEKEGDKTVVLDWRTPGMYQRALDCDFNDDEMGKLLTEACCKKYGIEYVPTPKDEQNANKGKGGKTIAQTKTPTHASRTAPKAEQTDAQQQPAAQTATLTPNTIAYHDSEGARYIMTTVDEDTVSMTIIDKEGNTLRKDIEVDPETVRSLVEGNGLIADAIEEVKDEQPAAPVEEQTKPQPKAEQPAKTKTITPKLPQTSKWVDAATGKTYIIENKDGICNVTVMNGDLVERTFPNLDEDKVQGVIKKNNLQEVKDEQPQTEQPAKTETKETNEANKPHETKETKPQPKSETPAPTIPLNLPDTILTTDLKDGRMTISGLTDLTGEQVRIFIAGMNAMREAIRKQMQLRMTADGMPVPTSDPKDDLPF